jgi:hypothetical protein
MYYSVTARLSEELYDFIKSYADANNSSINRVLSIMINELKEKLLSDDLSSDDISLVDLDDLFEPEEEIEKEEIDNQKNQKVQVKFITSEKIKSAIKELAKENYTSVSKYLDIFFTNYIENDKVRYTESELRLLHQYNYEIRVIGRSLNQITKQINSGKLKVLDEYIVELIKEVNNKIIEYSNAIKDIVIKNKPDDKE